MVRNCLAQRSSTEFLNPVKFRLTAKTSQFYNFVSASSFTFIDLFAGIGGFHLAMHHLGGKCVFASEIDPYERVVRKQVISPDGKVVAEATSKVVVSGDRQTKTSQYVSTTVTSNYSSSSSSYSVSGN
ncbi:MAG: hypothetical protein RLZZ74_2915 [Cyanobacteriota bacterium]